jgi:polysaccharide biosynthesis protein PslH
MKLLMLVSRVPWPLEKGDKLRAYHQLCELAKSHQVQLCCLSDSAPDPEAIEHLKKITPHVKVFQLNRGLIIWRLFYALFSRKPFQVHYFFQTALARELNALIDEFQPEHIYCQLIRTSEYVKHLLQYKKTLDYMDALSAGYSRRINAAPWWQKPFVKEEARRLIAYENLIYEYFEFHTIISTQDQQLIMHPQRAEIAVVPNGVDASFFSPSSNSKKYDFVFSGNMSYPPNVECARRLVLEILPIIHKTAPNTTLLIAGAAPAKEVWALNGGNVTVSGWMEDIREGYANSRIFIAPMLSGSGMQNKLLEAMSMQLPCITTPLAANAIGGQQGVHMLIGSSNQELASLALELLNDENKAQSIANL